MSANALTIIFVRHIQGQEASANPCVFQQRHREGVPTENGGVVVNIQHIEVHPDTGYLQLPQLHCHRENVEALCFEIQAAG